MLKSPLAGGEDGDGGRGGGGGRRQKKAISPIFDASGNQNISAPIRIGREILCLPYAGFLRKVISNPIDHNIQWATEFLK